LVVSKGPDAFRTISEVAEDLDLPQHVLRFWETRFPQIRPLKRGGGRRYYRPDDVDLLRGIRQLLYGEGYTIKGVQRILREQGHRFVIAAGRGEINGAEMAAHQAAAEPGELGDLDEAEVFEGFDPDMEPADAGPAPPRPTSMPRVEMPARATESPRRFVERLVAKAGSGGAHLGDDDVRRLQGTLAELLECKRLLDQAR
jgi:DNA-binding transcriptional MerR regulator